MDDKQCDGCHEKNSCQQLYQRIGNSDSPNIVWKVTAAFLIPMLIFTVVLAVCQMLFESAEKNQSLRIILSVAVSVGVVVLYAAIARRITNNKRQIEVRSKCQTSKQKHS